MLNFLMGPTNAGKSTLLLALRKVQPDESGYIEVGKKLRAKYLDPASPHYDPDYFKGQAAPAHTAEEAYSLMEQGIAASTVDNVFIDGQPRDIQQAKRIYNTYVGRVPTRFIHLFCPRKVRQDRIAVRDAANPDALALSTARLDHDVICLYEVMSLIQSWGVPILTIDSSGASPDEIATRLMKGT